MANSNAINYARSAQTHASSVRGFTENQTQLAIAQAIYELARAVEALGRGQE